MPVAFRLLHDEREARQCAGLLVASEPWITLGLTIEQAIKRLIDPARESYVATAENQIVGVLVLFLGGTLKGYVQIIAVHPDWRSRGIGRQIIEFAERRIFRLSPNVFLCVSSFNVRAQRFYERLGYQRVGELTDFVVNGHSEFLMRKTCGSLRDFKPGG